MVKKKNIDRQSNSFSFDRVQIRKKKFSFASHGSFSFSHWSVIHHLIYTFGHYSYSIHYFFLHKGNRPSFFLDYVFLASPQASENSTSSSWNSLGSFLRGLKLNRLFGHCAESLPIACCTNICSFLNVASHEERTLSTITTQIGLFSLKKGAIIVCIEHLWFPVLCLCNQTWQ